MRQRQPAVGQPGLRRGGPGRRRSPGRHLLSARARSQPRPRRGGEALPTASYGCTQVSSGTRVRFTQAWSSVSTARLQDPWPSRHRLRKASRRGRPHLTQVCRRLFLSVSLSAPLPPRADHESGTTQCGHARGPSYHTLCDKLTSYNTGF